MVVTPLKKTRTLFVCLRGADTLRLPYNVGTCLNYEECTPGPSIRCVDVNLVPPINTKHMQPGIGTHAESLINRQLILATYPWIYQTCRDLSIIMNDRSLWILALRDILTVMPLKGIRETMSSMSLREIRATTVRATRVNEVFAHEEIEPVIVKRSLFGKGSTTLVELGPRGQWMLTFDNNGTLSFYRTLDHHTPLLVMHRPKCRTAYYWDFDRKYVLIRIVRGEHVVVVSEIYYAYRSVLPLMLFESRLRDVAEKSILGTSCTILMLMPRAFDLYLLLPNLPVFAAA